MTPHVGGVTDLSRQKMSQVFVDNVRIHRDREREPPAYHRHTSAVLRSPLSIFLPYSSSSSLPILLTPTASASALPVFLLIAAPYLSFGRWARLWVKAGLCRKRFTSSWHCLLTSKRQGERERGEKEKEVLFTACNKWQKVGKHNALSGNTTPVSLLDDLYQSWLW